MKSNASSVEPLEARIAPAAVLTFQNLDGETIKIASSKGTKADLMNAATISAFGELDKLDVSHTKFPTDIFAGADITISVSKLSAHPTNIFANVGFIDATGIDLGTVTVNGDLGKIDAGDGDSSTAGVKSLNVHSLGVLGTKTGAPDLDSTIIGALKTLKVTTDMKDALLLVGGSNALHDADGSISTLTIGGSLIGGATANRGEIFTTGDMGAVKIGHNLEGGAGTNSGSLFTKAGGKIASVNIGGSIIGGAGDNEAEIASSAIGPVTIGHDVKGGSGSGSGEISSLTSITSISIGGSLIGDAGFSSGSISAPDSIGAVKIGHDLHGSSGSLSGRIGCQNGKIASVTIGGTFAGGSNTFTGEISSNKIGPVKIGHDLAGGTASQSGRIIAVDSIEAVTLGGSLIGGTTGATGIISAGGAMGFVKIGGDVRGGSGGLDSAMISSGAKLAGVSIGGSLIGGAGDDSAEITSMGAIGPVKIGHDLLGGDGHASGNISGNSLTSIVIGGSLIGKSFTTGAHSGNGIIQISGDIGAVTIMHDLIGGSVSGTATLDFSGVIESFGGRIDSVSVGGSIVSGSDDSTTNQIGGDLTRNASIRADNDLGSLMVKGDIRGNQTLNGNSPVIVSARGQAVPGAKTDLAIGAITVGGGVEFFQILAGYDGTFTPKNADAQIGPVKVEGNWAASSLAAGAVAGGNGFGMGDTLISGAGTTNTAGIISKIASIAIGGQVIGSTGSGDHFGFVAEQVGSFKMGGVAIPLQAAMHTDDLSLIVLTTNDVTIHEI
ncbi:MAG: hypothetical protein WCF18_13640 [Chthoniobacteraceae bacterium]